MKVADLMALLEPFHDHPGDLKIIGMADTYGFEVEEVVLETSAGVERPVVRLG